MKLLSKYDNLSGTFGRLKVLSLAYVSHGIRYYFAECACDKSILIRADSLVTGNTKSCGCYNVDTARQLIVKRSTTHNESKSRLYGIWSGIKKRCYNTRSSAYSRYGARGISLCDMWKDFKLFKEWAIANGYDDTLEIDRIDVDGNYCPENCRWVTDLIQSRNRQYTTRVEIEGKEYFLSDLSQETGIKHSTLYFRIKNNVDKSQLLKDKIKRINEVRVDIDGNEESIKSLSQKTGVSKSAIESRIRVGVEGSDLLLTNQFPYRYLTIQGEVKTIAEWSRLSGVPRNTIVGRVARGVAESMILQQGRIKNF